MNACPSEDQLHDLMAGRMPEKQVSEVHRHLDTCSSCYALIVALARDAIPERPPRPRSSEASGAAPPQAEFSDGQQVDAYVVTGRLGSGGMGTVYAAIDPVIQHRVAIKVLHASCLPDASSRRRFLTEARAANQVRHPSFLNIQQVGQLSDGSPFIIMELLEGDVLRARMRRSGLSSREGLVPLLAQVAEAMAAAHERGVVHRDLKPDNIMIVRDPMVSGGERIKILDLGLAKLLTPQQDLPLTRSGTVLGTPVYMSPEQVRSSPHMDGKTDVYALGVILHEALTGAPPFAGADAAEILAMHLRDPPPALRASRPDLPAALEALLLEMLCKSPAGRPSMTEVARRLAALHLPPRTDAPPTPPRPRLTPRAARRAAILLLAGSVAAGGAILSRWHARRSAEEAPPGMVLLPGGTFIQGSSPEETLAALDYCKRTEGARCRQEIYEREHPPHEVSLSPFFLDQTEVTNERFAAWLEAQPDVSVDRGRLVRQGEVLLVDLFPAYGNSGLRHDPSGQPRFTARSGMERKPVVQVTWTAATRYCASQGKMLPTEAQWEFAARGGKGLRFPWGDDQPRCAGVAFGRLLSAPCAHLGTGTENVGQSRQDRSPHGVFDLGANVSEWVRDQFVAPYPPCPAAGRGACQDPIHDPPGAAASAQRAVRGGDWYQGAEACRAAGRSRLEQDQVRGNIGFRCSRPAGPVPRSSLYPPPKHDGSA